MTFPQSEFNFPLGVYKLCLQAALGVAGVTIDYSCDRDPKDNRRLFKPKF